MLGVPICAVKASLSILQQAVMLGVPDGYPAGAGSSRLI